MLELCEYVEIAGNSGYVLGGNESEFCLFVTDEKKVVLSFASETYDLGQLDEMEVPPQEGDDWTHADWVRWHEETIAKLDERHLFP